MTGPFFTRPPPDHLYCNECDSDGHLRRQDVNLLTKSDPGLERDGGEGFNIYAPMEARKGKGENRSVSNIKSKPIIPIIPLRGKIKGNLPETCK